MARIEAGLHEHHASIQRDAQLLQSSTAAATASSSGQTPSSTDATPASVIETPFAKINSVTAGSPAEQAGLRAGDVLRRFGTVNWMNHEKLTKIAELVRDSEGVGYRCPERAYGADLCAQIEADRC